MSMKEKFAMWNLDPSAPVSSEPMADAPEDEDSSDSCSAFDLSDGESDQHLRYTSDTFFRYHDASSGFSTSISVTQLQYKATRVAQERHAFLISLDTSHDRAFTADCNIQCPIM